MTHDTTTFAARRRRARATREPSHRAAAAAVAALLALAIPYPNPLFRGVIDGLLATSYGFVGLVSRHPERTGRIAAEAAMGALLLACIGALWFARLVRRGGAGQAVRRVASVGWRALRCSLLATLWFGVCTLRHPEAALAAAAALVVASLRGHSEVAALVAAGLVFGRPQLAPAIVLGTLVFAITATAARRPGWLPITRSLRSAVVGAAAATLVGFLGGIVRPPDPDLAHHTLPRRVYDLAVDASGSRLAFTTKGLLAPGILDRQSGSFAVIARLDPLGFERLAWLPASTRVVSGGGSGVSILDLGRLAVERHLSAVPVIDVALAGDERLAYAEEGSNAVRIVDLTSGRTESLAIPHGPYALEFEPSTDALYVTSWLDEPKVTRLGLGDGSHREAWNGWGSTDVCVLPARGEVAVARPAYGDIAILDAATLARRRLLPCDALVREIECDAARGVLYASAYFDGRVTALDVERGAVLDSVRIGPFARALRYSADHDTLFAGSNAGLFELPIEGGPDGSVRFRRVAHAAD